MGKHILLIAVNTGELTIGPKDESPAIANVTALKQTLLSEVEGLRDDQLITLVNPNLRQMRHAIALMTYRCRHGDLCFLYYTGCGVIDTHTGSFYLPATDTRLEAITTTAISSDYIRQALPSIQTDLNRLMVLDCLWSSLPQSIHDSDSNVANSSNTLSFSQLADCNCTLLTALSGATNPWPLVDKGLSLYTQCLIQGIATGLADTDADGGVSIEDLQTYMEQTLGKTTGEMFPVALHSHHCQVAGPLLAIPPYAPEQEYRRSLEEYARCHQGHIPPASRNILEFLRHQLGLSIYQSQTIEAEVMAPYSDRQEGYDRYRQALLAALELENPLGTPLKKWLRHLQ